MEQLKRVLLSFGLLLVGTIMYAQSEISGTVLDPTGETVIGATVMEKGTLFQRCAIFFSLSRILSR